MRKRLSSVWEAARQAAKGNGQRREIPEDFKYNKKKIKHLQHILHNVSVAQGTLVSALAELSRVKGRDISPDGLLGGLGYILPLKDIKQGLITSVHQLSDISDCIADELTNPRWKAEDDAEVKKVIKEKEEVEEKVEEQIEDSDISPDDVITSNEIEENEERKASMRISKVLSSVVTQALVAQTSIRKTQS